MHVLLLVPTFDYKAPNPVFLSASDFPMGLAYIASALKRAGHTVRGLNLNNNTEYSSAEAMVKARIEETLCKGFDLIGLGGLCIDYKFIKDAMQVIRNETSTPIVLGGGIMKDADYIFNRLKPDYAIEGEGEEAVVKLADAIANGGDIREVDNLHYWDNDKPEFTRKNYDYGDIDDRAFPDYDTFGISDMVENFSMFTRLSYRYPRYNPKPMTITTARSCPFSCTFCVHSGGPKYRARKIASVMEEIKQLYDKHKFNILVIADELFVANKGRVKEFCQSLLENKAKYGWDFVWTFQTHANSHLDRDTLQLVKDAGCFMFSYGIESGSPAILKSMRKNSDINTIIETIKMADDIGIGFGGNLLYGDPAETNVTVGETLKFYLDNSNNAFIFFSPLIPFPGCELFDHCIREGIIKDKDEYYETIGERSFNMTKMDDVSFMRWWEILNCSEISYAGLKKVDGTVELDPNIKNIVEGYEMYKIKATCPFCEKESTYSELTPNVPVFFVVGCQHCYKRIIVNLLGEILRRELSEGVTNGTIQLRHTQD